MCAVYPNMKQERMFVPILSGTIKALWLSTSVCVCVCVRVCERVLKVICLCPCLGFELKIRKYQD